VRLRCSRSGRSPHLAIPRRAPPTRPARKFCSAYTKISGRERSADAEASEKRWRRSSRQPGKEAPGNVKAAANRIVSVLTKLGGISASNAADLGKFYTSARLPEVRPGDRPPSSSTPRRATTRQLTLEQGLSHDHVESCSSRCSRSPRSVVLASPRGGLRLERELECVSASRSRASRASSRTQAPTRRSSARATFKKFAAALRSSGRHAPANVKKAREQHPGVVSMPPSAGVTRPTCRTRRTCRGAIGTYFGYVAAHC